MLLSDICDTMFVIVYNSALD